MDNIIQFAFKIATFMFVLLFVWSIYSDFNDRSHRFLFKLLRFFIAIFSVVMVVICRHHGWQ